MRLPHRHESKAMTYVPLATFILILTFAMVGSRIWSLRQDMHKQRPLSFYDADLIAFCVQEVPNEIAPYVARGSASREEMSQVLAALEKTPRSQILGRMIDARDTRDVAANDPSHEMAPKG